MESLCSDGRICNGIFGNRYQRPSLRQFGPVSGESGLRKPLLLEMAFLIESFRIDAPII